MHVEGLELQYWLAMLAANFKYFQKPIEYFDYKFKRSPLVISDDI